MRSCNNAQRCCPRRGRQRAGHLPNGGECRDRPLAFKTPGRGWPSIDGSQSSYISRSDRLAQDDETLSSPCRGGVTATQLSARQRRLAACGILGAGGFVVAWAVCGWAREGYSPINDAISRLAEVGSPRREWMTAGFAAFGIGVPIYARALRIAVPGPAWLAATITGVATLGVGAAPLGRADTAHNVFATVGYVSLAALPLLAAPTFRRAGAAGWARWSAACGLGSAVALMASTLDRRAGLTQRLGLGIIDLWIVGTAWSMWRHGNLPPDPSTNGKPRRQHGSRARLRGPVAAARSTAKRRGARRAAWTRVLGPPPTWLSWWLSLGGP